MRRHYRDLLENKAIVSHAFENELFCNYLHLLLFNKSGYIFVKLKLHTGVQGRVSHSDVTKTCGTTEKNVCFIFFQKENNETRHKT